MAEGGFTMFVSKGCPYCEKAMNLLLYNALDFTMYNYESDSEKLLEAKARENWKTVPMIWKGEEFIGGFTDLERFIQDGSQEKKTEQEG